MLTSTAAALTPRELADRWHCSPETVLDLIRAGRLRAFSLSPPGSKRPRWRVSQDAVADYEAGHAARQPVAPARRQPSRKRLEYQFYP